MDVRKISQKIGEMTTPEQRKMLRAISTLSNIVSEGVNTLDLVTESVYKRLKGNGIQIPVLNKKEIKRQIKEDGLIEFLEKEGYVKISNKEFFLTSLGFVLGFQYYILLLWNIKLDVKDIVDAMVYINFAGVEGTNFGTDFVFTKVQTKELFDKLIEMFRQIDTVH